MNAGQHIIANSPLAMATTVGPQHILHYVNGAFCELCGKNAEEIVGHPMTEALPAADVTVVLALLDSLYGGGASGLVINQPDSLPGRDLPTKSYVAWGLPSMHNHEDGLVIQVCELSGSGSDRLRFRKPDSVPEGLTPSRSADPRTRESSGEPALDYSLPRPGSNAAAPPTDAFRPDATGIKPAAGWPSASQESVPEGALTIDSLANGVSGRSARSESWPFQGEIDNLSSDIRQINEQLVFSALRQQTINEALTLDLKRNRAIAEAMQYAVLWPHPEKLFPGLNVAVFYEPASIEALVGGDFFDAFKLPNGSIMLVVGDVTGKGLKAATRTVEVRFALRAFAQTYENPAEIMERLNAFICDFHQDDDVSNELIALAIGVVDPIRGDVRITCAGAESPLVLRASGAVEEIDTHGLILGIDRKTRYEMVNLSIDAGDTLIMTTDGLTEARCGRGFFGYERLIDTMRQTAPGALPKDIGTAILHAVHAYTSGRVTDDICLLMARRIHD